MLVESAAGWPFDKFDLANSNSLEERPIRDLVLSDSDHRFIRWVETFLKWDGSDQKLSFSWRILIDTSNIYSSMVGLPGPSFRGIAPFRKFTPIFSHEAWLSNCPHSRRFPSDCDICRSSDVPNSCSEMSFHPGRNDLLAQLDAEQLNSQQALAEKPLTTDFPMLVKESGEHTRGKIKSGLLIRPRESCVPSEVQSSKKGRSTSLTEISSSEGDIYTPSPNRNTFALGSCSLSEQPFPEASIDPLDESLMNFGLSGPCVNDVSQRPDLYHALYNMPSLRNLNLSKISDIDLQIGLGLATRISQEDIVAAPLVEGQLYSKRMSDVISTIAIAASQACSLLARENNIFNLRENELTALHTRVEDGRLEALRKLDASEKHLCEVKTNISQLKLDLEKKNEELVRLRDSHKEELRSHGAFASDEGAYHVLRCLLHASNYHSSMSISQKKYLFQRWLMTKPDDISLRPLHSDIPFNKNDLDDMYKKTMWVPPPDNPVNLRDMMVKCDARVRERSEVENSVLCEQRKGESSSFGFIKSSVATNPFQIPADVAPKASSSQTSVMMNSFKLPSSVIPEVVNFGKSLRPLLKNPWAPLEDDVSSSD